MRPLVTFRVSDVEPGARPLPPLDRAAALAALLDGRVEQSSTSDLRLVSATDVNPLVSAAHVAFSQHFPLLLSPDAVWHCLAQALALSVAQVARSGGAAADEQRARLAIRHAGALTLSVERRDFVLGQANPWPEAFAAFSEQIAAHVGRLRDLVVADFSTTGPTERAASEVLLMDVFQPFFQYEMAILCGIPSVSLVGTLDDWRSVRARAAMLGDLGLDWWMPSLLPVLDEIVASAAGRADADFWRSFFRFASQSGGQEVTGWIGTLFPFLQHGDGEPFRNPFLRDWREVARTASVSRRPIDVMRDPHGPPLGAFPSAIASAPVKVRAGADAAPLDMRFVAGLFGVAQDPTTLEVAPEFGWAVVHDDAARGARRRTRDAERLAARGDPPDWLG